MLLKRELEKSFILINSKVQNYIISQDFGAKF